MPGPVLGCVLAGGQSTRFGSDKALAELAGRSLLERAIDSLGLWCAQVVVAGRTQAPAPTVPDWPRAGMGPLGGIAGALRHAEAHGFASVLTCGVDSPDLPADLPDFLAPAPACLESQPVVGLWPVATLPALARLLAGDGRHSLRAFAEAVGARTVKMRREPANINTSADLAVLEKRLGETNDGL